MGFGGKQAVSTIDETSTTEWYFSELYIETETEII
jgi:hypothetical protein